jgi:hypothetical protein
MNHKRIFQAVWIGPTDKRGHRVRITDHRNRRSVVISVPYDDDEHTAATVAQAFLLTKGIVCDSYGEGKLGYFLTSDNFENQIK